MDDMLTALRRKNIKTAQSSDVEFIDEIIDKLHEGDTEYAIKLLADWKEELIEERDQDHYTTKKERK